MSIKHFIVLSLICAIAVAIRVQAVRHQRAQMIARIRPYGRYNAQQAIDRATPIFRVLLPQRDSLYLDAEKTEMHLPDGLTHRYWDVNCSDEQGNLIAHLLRDADTGLVCKLSNIVFISNNMSLPGQRPIPATQAATEARNWLRILGAGGRWRLIDAPTKEIRCWVIGLYAPGQKSYVSIDAYTAGVVDVRIEPKR
jgi:hypothetical protein